MSTWRGGAAAESATRTASPPPATELTRSTVMVSGAGSAARSTPGSSLSDAADSRLPGGSCPKGTGACPGPHAARNPAATRASVQRRLPDRPAAALAPGNLASPPTYRCMGERSHDSAAAASPGKRETPPRGGGARSHRRTGSAAAAPGRGPAIRRRTAR